MFCLNLNHSGRKCRHIHILGLELPVATAVPTPQFQTSQAFTKYPQHHYLPELMALDWLWWLCQSWWVASKSHLFWTYFGVLQLLPTIWLSVQRYSLEQIHSHILVTVLWAHEHACSALWLWLVPLQLPSVRWGFSLPCRLLPYPLPGPDQILGHSPVLLLILSYLHMLPSKIGTKIVVLPQICSVSLGQWYDYLPELVPFDDNV